MSDKKVNSFIKAFGPGLLFASAAIGTSHLILATQGGAHYGPAIGWVILVALVAKYPFFEFGPRYATATGKSLLSAYIGQGRSALVAFAVMIGLAMFTVVGAVGAASAGLFITFAGFEGLSMTIANVVIFIITAVVLIIGRFALLDHFIKFLSVILLVSVLIAFTAVVINGPVDKIVGFEASSLMDADGLLIIIGLLGWMPVGLEASAFSSIWTVVKMKQTGYHPSMSESLADFNIGYGITTLLAFVFLIIGAWTVYGTGVRVEGNPVVFSSKLVSIFTEQIGGWAFSIISIGAFGAIYGTLITAWDAFARSMDRCIHILRTGDEPGELKNLERRDYVIWIIIIGVGAFIVIAFFGHSLGLLLNIATAISFLFAPLIAVLNLRAIKSLDQSVFGLSRIHWIVTYAGFAFMTAFAIYYLYRLLV